MIKKWVIQEEVFHYSEVLLNLIYSQQNIYFKFKIKKYCITQKISINISDMSKAAQAQSTEAVKELVKPEAKIFERIWGLLFLIASIFVLVLSNKIYLFHTMPEFKDIKKGSLLDLIKYSIPFGVFIILIDKAVHLVMDPWVEKNFLRKDKYVDTAIRQKKSRFIVRWGFNVFYYSIMSIFAYYLIKDTSFLPPILGGHGEIYSLIEHRYLDEATFGMEVIYYMQFGKHVARLFCHLFITPEGSFYEYLLHHSLSTFLIFFSYSMDMWVIGIVVMFCHDIPDMVLSFGRMYRERYQRQLVITWITYICAIGSWIGLRVICFGYSCVFAAWYTCFVTIDVLNPVQDYVFRLPYMFMAFMLNCLLVMHIFWIYYIIKSFIASNVSSKIATDSYNQ